MILLFGWLSVTALGCALGYALGRDHHGFPEYVRLISDIQDFFGSSSVFIVNAGHYENPSDLLLMSKISREFSGKFVLSQTINFTKFHQEILYYNGKTVQPLFVIMLRTLGDLERFAATIGYQNMALHKWLLIFEESQELGLAEYCERPRGNPLNLVVSTKMLVKCSGRSVLREWFSIDRETVEARDYGSWSRERGMLRLTMRNFYERRSDFKGHRLRVSSVKGYAPGVKRRAGTGDFFVAVLAELARMMNFTMEHVSAEESYGIWNATRNRWTGVIGKLVAREADVGVGEFTMNRQRAEVVDYTLPLMLTFSDIYIRRPDMTVVSWSGYVKAFHKDIWVIIVLILMAAPLILAMLCKIVRGSDITYHYLGEEYLNVWGIYCQKSLSDFPAASSLRIAYISIFTSSLVLYAVYSAYLTSYLTVSTPVMPFSSYDAFVHDGTYRLIVLRDSATHELFTRTPKSIFSEMGKLLKKDEDLPHNIYAAINQVCHENVVLFTNQLFIEKTSRYSPCEVISLTHGRLDNLGFVLTKSSPYTDIMNYNLKIMRAYGIIERLRRRYFGKFEHVDSSYLPVTFLSALPILGIFCLGLALAGAVLVCELATHRQPAGDATSRSSGPLRRWGFAVVNIAAGGESDIVY